MKKENTKAGIRSLSASVAADSFTICDTRSRSFASASATSEATLVGPWQVSASEKRRQSALSSAAAVTPCERAHNFPVQPLGSASATEQLKAW